MPGNGTGGSVVQFSLVGSLCFLLQFLFTIQLYAQSFTAAQYREALWMATRFFGAQRSGHGPNWLLQDSEHPTSFVQDAINGHGVSGGWFDCGDHVMFGQTQFFASYVLAKTLANFPNAWHDLYHGDYSDYKASQNYSIAGGQPNGIPDLLEELRYQADFLVKAAPNPGTFIYQKGNPDFDHSRFVTAGVMSTLANRLGGESEGSRPIFLNPADGNMPALASATLAIMARLDPDPQRRQQYILHAYYALQYAMNHNGFTGSTPSRFYLASDFNARGLDDGKANAALEIYRSTGDLSMRSLAWELYLQPSRFGLNHNWRFDYANDEALAFLNITQEFGPQAWSTQLERWMDSSRMQINVSQNRVSTFKSTQDGTNLRFATRGPIGYAFIHGLYSRIRSTVEFEQFIFDQIDFVLGQNTQNQSFVVGWDKNGKIPPSHPHHRNIYGNTNPNVSQRAMDSIPQRNKYLGAIIGGSLDGTYDANIDNFSMNEPCIDMNATFVGALAYAVQRLMPTENSLQSHQVPVPLANPGRSISNSLRLEQAGSLIRVHAGMEKGPLEVELLDLQGRRQSLVWSEQGSSPWLELGSGVQILIVRQGKLQSSIQVVGH